MLGKKREIHEISHTIQLLISLSFGINSDVTVEQTHLQAIHTSDQTVKNSISFVVHFPSYRNKCLNELKLRCEFSIFNCQYVFEFGFLSDLLSSMWTSDHPVTLVTFSPVPLYSLMPCVQMNGQLTEIFLFVQKTFVLRITNQYLTGRVVDLWTRRKQFFFCEFW